MPYFINPIEEDQCVFLTYAGKMPPLEVVAARYEASGLLAAKHWNQIVVDVTASRSVEALELLDLVRGLTADLPRRSRVTLAMRPEQAKYTNLVEEIARNAGVLLALFFDAEEAISWVKDATSQKRTQRRPSDKPL
jgi:hypothetical protein